MAIRKNGFSTKDDTTLYIDNEKYDCIRKKILVATEKLVFDTSKADALEESINGLESTNTMIDVIHQIVDLTDAYREHYVYHVDPFLVRLQESYNKVDEEVADRLIVDEEIAGSGKLTKKSKQSSKKKKRTKENDFYNLLIKCGVDAKKLKTDDGYFIIDKSLAEIFTEAGVDTKVVDLSLYDDWYITGLVKDDGNVVYSIIKVREPMDEQDAKAVAVPFMSLDITAMETILENTHNGKKVDKNKVNYFIASIDRLCRAEENYNDYNQELLDYFNDPKSDGSYLIADFTIDKLAHDKVFENGGTYKLPFEYDEFDEYGGKETLDYLAKVGVYNKKKNTITIGDSNNLTEDERTALLLIATGDRDKYAYAAENQYHADMYSKWYAGIRIKKSAIKSDAGVGESKGISYEAEFKETDGKYYLEQNEAHNNEKNN